ncbi:hypothetical protein B4135_3656 [Caldibacillus debilis]|uniref:Uncharacterized protein n=1 Tax=Caldibacillus debilis TaxID=301148 RepID=A0A150LC79_9BACI|nr:hypothetical protein B4135_3656 [Caldibacillus debilis]
MKYVRKLGVLPEGRFRRLRKENVKNVLKLLFCPAHAREGIVGGIGRKL